MRLTLLFLLAILTECLFAQGTFKPEPPPDPKALNKVTVTCEPEGAANLSGTGYYDAGTEITINQSSTSGNYRFEKWTLNGEDYYTNEWYSYFYFTVPEGESEFVAHYTDLRTIRADVHIQCEPANSGCNVNYSNTTLEQGYSLDLYTDGPASYEFLGWYKDDQKISDDKYFWFTMPTPCEETTLVAKWKFNPILPSDPKDETLYEITGVASPAEGGSIIGGKEYKENATATLFAKANENWEFVMWQDGNIENPREIYVYGDASYTAIFRNIATSYKTLSFSCYPKNACSFNRGDSDGKLVFIGEEVTLETYRSQGFEFLGWYEGDTKVSETEYYNFTMPDRNYTLVARYIYKPVSPVDPKDYENPTGLTNTYLETEDLVDIYDSMGQVIAIGANPKTISQLIRGVYIVKSKSSIKKVIIK